MIQGLAHRPAVADPGRYRLNAGGRHRREQLLGRRYPDEARAATWKAVPRPEGVRGASAVGAEGYRYGARTLADMLSIASLSLFVSIKLVMYTSIVCANYILDRSSRSDMLR